MSMKHGDRLIGYGLIGDQCDYTGCKVEGQKRIRHIETGAIVTARCKAHQSPSWRMKLDNGHCPKCSCDIRAHHDEVNDRWAGCDYAIEALVNAAELAAEGR